MGPNHAGRVPFTQSIPVGTEPKVGNDLALAAQYRKHAQELRGVAGERRPAWANVALRKAADDYDRMAKSLERIWRGRPHQPCASLSNL